MMVRQIYSDAARRVSDTYTLHRLADVHGNVGRWFAVSLADGRSDDVLYDSRRTCIRHQKGDELNFAYIQIIPRDMTVREAEAFLTGERKAAAAGIRTIDPDLPGGGPVVIPRLTKEDQRSQIRALFGKGARPRNLLIPGRDF